MVISETRQGIIVWALQVGWDILPRSDFIGADVNTLFCTLSSHHTGWAQALASMSPGSKQLAQVCVDSTELDSKCMSPGSKQLAQVCVDSTELDSKHMVYRSRPVCQTVKITCQRHVHFGVAYRLQVDVCVDSVQSG